MSGLRYVGLPDCEACIGGLGECGDPRCAFAPTPGTGSGREELRERLLCHHLAAVIRVRRQPSQPLGKGDTPAELCRPFDPARAWPRRG